MTFLILFLTLFDPKTSFLVLLAKKKFRKSLAGFKLRGEGVPPPPNSAKGFLEKWFSVKGVGAGTPLTVKIL